MQFIPKGPFLMFCIPILMVLVVDDDDVYRNYTSNGKIKMTKFQVEADYSRLQIILSVTK